MMNVGMKYEVVSLALGQQPSSNHGISSTRSKMVILTSISLLFLLCIHY